MAIVRGTNWDDYLYGGPRDATIYGLGGDDTIEGGGGFNSMFGGPGDDLLIGGVGGSFFIGGEGRDSFEGRSSYLDAVLYYWDGGRNGVTVDLARQSAIDSYGDRDDLHGIEGAIGTGYDDRLIGQNGRSAMSALAGLAGDDTITGGRGHDILHYDYDTIYRGNRGVTVGPRARPRDRRVRRPRPRIRDRGGHRHQPRRQPDRRRPQ